MITDEQEEWVMSQTKRFNLGKFFRKRLDEYMEFVNDVKEVKNGEKKVD